MTERLETLEKHLQRRKSKEDIVASGILSRWMIGDGQ